MADNKDHENYGTNNNDQHKLVFENVYGELEFYKKKCDILEKDLFKSLTQIKKLEISLKKSQEINAVNGKNLNNTSISFLLPSEFKTLWENFAKNLVLEAYDCLYDDYSTLSHLTLDTLLITYNETNKYMLDKVGQVLKVLNINISNKDKLSDLDKFLTRFKSIFQDHFVSIFSYTEEFNECIKFKLIKELKLYEVFSESNDNRDSLKLEEIINEMEKKPFKNMIQVLFKLCIYMLLHEPVLTLGITNYNERQLKYLYFNKNELINIEGFGTDQTPCIVIVPPPNLRKDFAYMGMKPAVYCIQKPQITENILQECEKNKIVPRNTSSSIDAITNNNSNINKINGSMNIPNKISVGATNNKNSPKKLATPKKASSSINKLDQSSNILTTPNKKLETPDNYQSNVPSKKDIQIQIKLKSVDHLQDEHAKENTGKNYSKGIINQVQETEENQLEKKSSNSRGKKCYDRPLMIKNRKIEEELNHHNCKPIRNTITAEINKQDEFIIETPEKNIYKSSTHNYNFKNSRNSSIGESNENSLDSKNINLGTGGSNLQNFQNALNNPSNITKSSRIFTSKTPVETEAGVNNSNTIPIRYIPTGSNMKLTSNTNSVNTGFNMVRTKNSKQIEVDNVLGKRETINSILVDKIYDTNSINYPLKERINSATTFNYKENLSDYRTKNEFEYLIKIENKYNDENNYHNYHFGKQFSTNEKVSGIKIEFNESQRKQINNYPNNTNMNFTNNNLNKHNTYSNLNNLVRKINNHEESISKMGSTSNILRLTPIEKKAESRIFRSSPTDLIEINSSKVKSFAINGFNGHEEITLVNADIKIHTNMGNTFNDMKYNGPKKDTFAINISNKDKEFETISVNSGKNDIRNQIGKYYNKIINDTTNKNVQNNNNSNINITNSPKSLHTYSTISNKSNKDNKDSKRYHVGDSIGFNKNNIVNNRESITKASTYYYNNFQNNCIKK